MFQVAGSIPVRSTRLKLGRTPVRGKPLQKSEGDHSQLQMKMIGSDLFEHLFSILSSCVMKIIVSVTTGRPLHVFEPEAVGECADLVDELFEAEFDAEAKTIEFNHAQRIETQVCPDQGPTALGGMNAPCQCGSGKKFRYCCMKRKKSAISDDEVIRF